MNSMIKNIITSIIFFTILWTLTLAYKEERSLLDIFTPYGRLIKAVINNKWEAVSARRFNSRNRILSGKFQDSFAGFDFPCNLNITLRSKEPPETAHRLRPGDIDVIGAIGDSLTAGFGIQAVNFLTIIHEGRGSSFSIGGAETWRSFLTLPNILKKYNPNIYGHSLNSISIDRKSKFNVAEGGAISENMPYMAKVLVKRIKSDKNVNLEKDWKMISIFIGHNDFCSVVCYKQDFDKVLQDHKHDMLDVLRIFRNNLPRTVINLIPPIHLRLLLLMTDKPQSCELPHLLSCPCLIGLGYLHLRSKILQFMTQWQQLDLEIADYEEFDRNDFTVIAHNFTINFTLPLTSSGGIDYEYVAPDCFHSSQRGHAKAANDLWNSLLEPYGQKRTDADKREFERFLCPTEANPYIYTKRNSIYSN